VCGTITHFEKEHFLLLSRKIEATMTPDKRSAWLRKLDEECPYQFVLPRQLLSDDSEIINFLIRYVDKFDNVEDDYAAFVRYCFENPLDAKIFRLRFEPKEERIKLAG
jgi:hypothetical protein